ncbi:SETD3/SETD6 methyltransferase [Pleurotus pulmonarius]
MANITDSRWDALLAWLAQHGMDLGELCVEPRERPGAGYGLFASEDCPPSMKLFTIPASALLNWKTLSGHYASPKQLNATCLISLHLLLHRPQGEMESTDPLFGPYISILPRDFDSHPLTWLAKSKIAFEETIEQLLLEALPQDVREALDALWNRLLGDWKKVCQYVRHHPASLTRATRPLESKDFNESDQLLLEFLWAWLNVNTRCIFHRLHASISNPDNFTMCPILDFANHTPDSSMSMQPMPTNADIWGSPQRSKGGDDFTLMASREITTKGGDELCLTYGAHCNTTLFVEYGFVNVFTSDMIAGGSFRGEVNVQNVMAASFDSGERDRAAWLKSTLEDEGYWGDWTLHASPPPAHPSFRLITALRLHSLVASTSKPTMTWESLQPWRAVLLGETEIVSEDNEDSWRKALLRICETIQADAEKQLVSSHLVEESQGKSWGAWMADNIRLLWLERIYVSAAVIRSVETGDQF